jgi:hypothetical protein
MILESRVCKIAHLFAVIIVVVISNVPAHADIIYSNLGTISTFLANGPPATSDPWTTYGDHATFGPGLRRINSVRFEFYANEAAGGQSTADLMLLIYDDDGGTVGSLLASKSIFAHTFDNRVRTVLPFSNMSVVVGNSAFVAVAIKSEVYFDPFYGMDIKRKVGVTGQGSPNPGSSDPLSMLEFDGFGLPAGSTATNQFPFDDLPYQNLRFEITAIPEPSGVIVVLSLLLAVAVTACDRVLHRGWARPDNDNYRLTVPSK